MHFSVRAILQGEDNRPERDEDWSPKGDQTIGATLVPFMTIG
jgi:hypothetical protein